MKNYYLLFCTKMIIFLSVLCSSAAIAQLPVVRITSPENKSFFISPATIYINATALDIGGRITKVEFFNGNLKLGEDLTAPYTNSWAEVIDGTYTLTARATDNSNNTTTSAAVTVIINDGLPVVSLTSPTTGSAFMTLATLNMTATAVDAGGRITKVEFFAYDALYQKSIKLGEDLTAPYTFNWWQVPNGTYTLTVRATDNSYNMIQSAPVTVVVNNGTPIVSLTSPTTGSTFMTPETIELTATAADANGRITKVDFFAYDVYQQKSIKLGEDLIAPYTFNWNGVPAGTYQLTAKATDNGFKTTTSAAVTIVMNSRAPIVSLTSPTTGSTFIAPATIDIAANATAFDGIRKVEFFNGSIKLGEDLTAPYTFSWTRVPAGTYQIRAKATDNLLRITYSASVTVVVNNTPAITATSLRISRLMDEQEQHKASGALFQSYPNPFTTNSTLAFAFDQEEEYEIKIYDATGTFVKALPKGQVKANALVQLAWADETISTGIYLIKLTSKQGTQTLRVVRE